MDLEPQENFSIIIPTYHEAKNIPELVKRIASVDFGQRHFEVILADDNSQDGTPDVVKKFQAQYPWLKLIIRHQKRDFSRSVLEGFEQASYPILITMDADLSHPPEMIPEILAMLSNPTIDVVIGSRYVKGGSTDSSWPLIRIITSRMAALIAKGFLFIKARDPLSGFLAIRQETVRSGKPFNPIGWKIGLELIVKCHCKNIREVPIHFSERREGASKLTLKISLEYLQHVARLFCHKILT
jgi:dolichol-phosphate mannosyltransferase